MTDRQYSLRPHAADPEVGRERREAARILRLAAGFPGRHDDELEWLFARMPRCLHARRLIIRRLMEQRDLDGAEAVILQGLLQRPNQPALLLLLAECQFRGGDLATARQTIDRVIRQRPWHVGARCLAARIALADHRCQHAVVHCDHARRRCRSSERLNALLCDALLATRAFARAELVLREQPTPDPVRLARLRIGQERFVDAADIINRALEQPKMDARQRTALCELLLDLFDRFEDRHRIIESVSRLPRSEPALMLRGAVSLLRCSAWSEAIRTAASLRDHRVFGGQALAIMLVAAHGADRLRLAHLTARRLQRRPDHPDPQWTAEAWLAGHLGRVLADQIAVPASSVDNASSLLDELIADAERVLSTGDPAAGRRTMPDSRRRELIDLCRLALAPRTARDLADRVPRAA